MTKAREKTLRKNRATFPEFPREKLAALDETLNILGFDLPQWTCLLEVMGKTDNGWLQFMRGDLCVDFEKFVDIDELHLRLELTRKGEKRPANYVFKLSELRKGKKRQRKSEESV